MLEKKEPLNLTGRVAVVTGGSSGIGLGVVEILSAYGAKVAMVDISPKGEEKAQELRAAGRDVTFFQCDVTSEEQVKTVSYTHLILKLTDIAGPVIGDQQFLSLRSELFQRGPDSGPEMLEIAGGDRHNIFPS